MEKHASGSEAEPRPATKLVWSAASVLNKKRKLLHPPVAQAFAADEQGNEEEALRQDGGSLSGEVQGGAEGSSAAAESLRLQAEGNALAEGGQYKEALGRWASAIALTPEKAVLHEQKAQLLLEMGRTWDAVQAATRATDLEPTWVEAHVTLGRAQLNLGEPLLAMQSAKRALVLQPKNAEAQADYDAARKLVQQQRQLAHTEVANVNRLEAAGIRPSISAEMGTGALYGLVGRRAVVQERAGGESQL